MLVDVQIRRLKISRPIEAGAIVFLKKVAKGDKPIKPREKRVKRAYP